MRKFIVLLIALVIITAFIYGCGEKTAEKTSTTTPEEEKVAPDVKPEEKIEEKKTMPKEIQDLITKSETKVQSMQYLLDIVTNQKAEGKNNIYYIKGDKIKIKLYEPLTTLANERYDTIYLDTSAKTAVAYCEDKTNPRCTDPNKTFVLSYSDVKVPKTPYQWIHSFTYAEVTGHETIENKQTTRIETPDGTILWVNVYNGMPVRVFTADTEYHFKDFATNHLKDSDVTHQFIPH